MTKLTGLLLLAIALAAAPTGRARAQPRSSEDAKQAIVVAREAKEQYDQGNWEAALARFEEAEVKAHSPVLVLYAARCHRNLGHLVRARSLYQSVVTEQLAPNAPAPFRDAKRDAQTDLESLEPRVPRLTLDRTRTPASWTIAIDGVAATGTDPVLLDPGRHVITASDGGAEKLRETLELGEGEARTFVVAPPSAVTPLPPKRDPRSEPVPPASRDEDEASVPAAAWIPGAVLTALGLGGVGAGVGTRVVAFQKVDEVKAGCQGNHCPPSARDDIEEAETLQTVSTVSFAVGGALAATGIVLLVVLPSQATGSPVAVSAGPASIKMTVPF